MVPCLLLFRVDELDITPHVRKVLLRCVSLTLWAIGLAGTGTARSTTRMGHRTPGFCVDKFKFKFKFKTFFSVILAIDTTGT